MAHLKGTTQADLSANGRNALIRGILGVLVHHRGCAALAKEFPSPHCSCGMMDDVEWLWVAVGRLMEEYPIRSTP